MLALLAGSSLRGDSGLRVTEAEAKRAAIAKPAPEYPMAARQLKVVGKVSLEVVVADDGHVSDVRIVSGNPILTKPAAEALRRWRFRPFLSGGKPSGAIAEITFEFDTQ